MPVLRDTLTGPALAFVVAAGVPIRLPVFDITADLPDDWVLWVTLEPLTTVTAVRKPPCCKELLAMTSDVME